jgi:hypothetical protein
VKSEYEWPVPEDADVLEALVGAEGDLLRRLPPKTEDLLIIFAHLHANGR